MIGVSERRICKALDFCRAAVRYKPRPRLRDERLKPILPILAWMEPRFGKRRLRKTVCNLLEHVSKGAFERLWQLLKLQVKPRKKRRFRSKALPVTVLRAQHQHEVWCMDFMKDWTLKGFPFRIFSVVDERTRRCLALVVAPSFKAQDVLDVLEGLILRHGATAGPYASLADAQKAGAVTINYGLFVNAIISFLIVAAAVFMLVRGVNQLKREKEAPPAAPTTKECPYCCSAIAIKATRCAHCTAELKA